MQRSSNLNLFTNASSKNTRHVVRVWLVFILRGLSRAKGEKNLIYLLQAELLGEALANRVDLVRELACRRQDQSNRPRLVRLQGRLSHDVPQQRQQVG